MKDTLIQKFLKFSYGSWIGLLIGLLTTMIATRLLTPVDFGKASMFDLFIQVGMILTLFGADQAFGRFFYEEEIDKRGALLYNTLKIPILSSCLLIILMLIFYKPITIFLFEHQSLGLTLVLALGIVSQLFFRFGQLVIRMQQKGNLYSLIQIFQKVFYLILIIIFFYFIGSNFVILIYSKIITLLLLIIIAIYYGKNFWSLKNLKVKNVKHTQKEIFHYGAPFVLSIFISWLFEAFDKIALRQWSTFDELGLYAAAMRLVALVMVLKATFSTFWTPIAYERFENRPNETDFFRYISIVVTFVMFLVAIISIAAKDLIVILLGEDFKAAAVIMPFLVFMPIFYTISETTVMGINFLKKTKWHIFIAVIACVVNIFGNWLLVPEYGAIGASIATAFSFVVFFTLRTIISLKYFKVNYPLVRIYTMVIIVSAYAASTIVIESLLLNILFSLIPFLVLILIFFKDLMYIIKNRRRLFD